MDGKLKKKQRHFSILVTGSSGCGKTSLINRLIKDTFNKEHVPTQYMDSMQYVAQVNGERIPVQIESLENVTDICERWEIFSPRKSVAILVGNKSDMKREINKDDVEIFAEKKHIPHIETSAKLNENVTEMFMSVIKRLIENGGDGTGYYDDFDDSDDGDDTVPITSKKNSSCSCVIS
ncbi:ras-related protein Rab-13-like isoform X2 [Mytilus edulis]|uniref:ras-related protein Rab-13-like isoform X2 n=1 Tax=Mytilus edulis TaxID=6550 RepID=UPI0039EDF08D